MNDYPYGGCILGRLHVPGHDEDDVVCYSKKRLVTELINGGMDEEDVDDYISYNVVYGPDTALLDDDA